MRDALRRLLPAGARRALRRAWQAIDARWPLHPLSCPICGRVPRFLPFDAVAPGLSLELERHGFGRDRLRRLETLHLERYGCPRCGATDRDRIAALWLRRALARGDGPRPLRLLDVAPSAPLSRLLARYPQIERRTADLTREDVDDRVDLTEMSIYEDGRFDALICSHVLEHVPDDRAAIGELNRVLAPGGWGLLLVPIFGDLDAVDEDPGAPEPERVRRFGQHDHLRAYTRDGFVSRLSAAGFRVERHGEPSFGAALFARSGIAPSSALYVAFKK